MFRFIKDLLQVIFKVVTSNRKNLIFTLLILQKQNEILNRHIDGRNERPRPKHSDRWTLAMISAISKKAQTYLQIFKPETVLSWQRKLIAGRWTFKKGKPGRKPVATEIKSLILEIKNDNYLWGCRRIADELGKLGIDIHHTTVNRIIQDFRKRGKIATSGSWTRFLKAHWESLFSMDFMTIDTLFDKRLYLLIVFKLSTREIVKWDLTEYPTREFVRQRIFQFQERHLGPEVLIHDNAPQFTTIDYQD